MLGPINGLCEQGNQGDALMTAANQLIDRAIKLLNSKELSKAYECLEAADREGAGARDLNLVWAMYYLRKNDSHRAISYLETELRLYPSNGVAIGLLHDLMQDTTISQSQVTTTPQQQQRTQIAEQLKNVVSSKEIKARVHQILSKLEKDISLERDLERYQYASRNGNFWFEQLNVLNWIAGALKPANYLEVGVRRGLAMAQVAVESPTTRIYGFDVWNTNLGSVTSSGETITKLGPEFVKAQLVGLGVKNEIQFEVGSSQIKLPAFFASKNNPQSFELITIDGERSYEGAKQDLSLAFEHLAPGGVLVFNDIYHHAHPQLLALWREYQVRYPDYLFIESHYHTGTGFAVKPPFDKIEKALKHANDASLFNAPKKLKLLMPYSVKRKYGKITLPEWIKESFRAYFSDQVEIIACGPGNEIDIADSPDFYKQVGQIVRQHSVDAIFDVEGGAESLDFMFKRFPIGITVPKLFWAIDTHQYLPLQVEKAKHFDGVYSAQKNALPSFGYKAQWLPAGASLHEVDLIRERTIPVGFVGSITAAHQRRTEIVKKLTEKVPGFRQFTEVFLDDKAELLSSMKIAVNVSMANDINFRVFETLATGALLLTDRIHKNGMEDLFTEGVHYVAYDSEEDLIAKIQYYLAHEEERVKIARAGQELVDQKFRHFQLLKRVIADFRRLSALTAQPAPATVVERRCWCGGTLHASVHPLYKQCDRCDTQVLEKLYTEEELKKFYSAEGYWHDRQVQVFNFPPIEERANNDFHDRIPVWFDMLNRFKQSPGNLLEIGCAHGGFLHYCRERGARNVVGVEVDEGTCQFARKRFNLAHVIAGLFPKVTLPFESFDAITGFDVIEHFIDPVEGLQGVSDKLSGDGICFFQTPCYRGEGQDWVQFKPAEHTFLYSEKAIRMLFDRVGLEVIEVFPGYFKDDMFVIGRKKTIRKSIVFVRADAIGDNLMATSLIAPLAAKYGEKLTVVCNQTVASLYERLPDVAQVITFDRNLLTNDDMYRSKIEQQLSDLKADVVLNSVYSRDAIVDFLSLACNARESIAFNGNLSNMTEESRVRNNKLYTHIIQSHDEHLPEILRHNDFLQALSIENTEIVPTIAIEQEDRKVVRQLLMQQTVDMDRILVLGAFSAHSAKNYPHWAEALIEVCKERKLSVVALGSTDDREASQNILDKLGVPTVNLCGLTTLLQSAAVIESAQIVVATDTSIPHIASALNKPNIVVLGGGHFGRFFPYSASTSVVCLPLECYGCNWYCKFSTEHCVKSVAPQVVAEAILFGLDGISSKPRVFVQSSSIRVTDSGTKQPTWKLFSTWLDPESVEIIVVGSARLAAKSCATGQRTSETEGTPVRLQ
jgi:ADP-heptose:LPS heptosyltransferase/predicted O-methyltransferase YrrM/2-polyprenyl-3-methyl-5-hydroxy-6-metoxy-1,4-benzoquinol methylase